MRHIHRFIIISALIFSNSAYALTLFLDAIDWRATETNDWAYVNSEKLPHQTIDYKTIDFNYAPGFRIGAIYTGTWDALLSYTRLYTATNASTTGNIRPSFSGSVTASPTGYLFSSGQVSQSINYNVLDLNVGKAFHPLPPLMLHPYAGLMGGWINQSIHAAYQGSISTRENITNNFTGMGPKAGVDANIGLWNNRDSQLKLMMAFAASYLLGHWDVSDIARVNPPTPNNPHATPSASVNVNVGGNRLGAFTLQSSVGMQFEHKQVAVKLAYEISDWFNQSQFFDNDTGTHNNDLILQGLTLGIAYSL